jgi:hypothetical protein
MKNSFLPLTLLFVLLAGAGCSPNHEANVRTRAQQLIVRLLQDDYAACAELTDPAFIQQYGLKGAEVHFRVIGAVVKIGNITQDKVRIDTVTIDSEAKSATVNISIQTGDEWKPINSQRWVHVEDQWYIAF